MKREDVSKIFEGATEEQINQILNINSADIGNAKQKAETERDGYKAQLNTAQTALKEFEGVDVKELQGKIDKLNNDLATGAALLTLPDRFKRPKSNVYAIAAASGGRMAKIGMSTAGVLTCETVFDMSSGAYTGDTFYIQLDMDWPNA